MGTGARVLPMSDSDTSYCQLSRWWSVRVNHQSSTGLLSIVCPMYSPNKYYQPYTASSDRSSRRGSVSSQQTGDNNNVEITSLTGGQRRTSCRCCCLTALLTLLTLATLTGILVWVLNRQEAPSTVNNNLLGNISNDKQD